MTSTSNVFPAGIASTPDTLAVLKRIVTEIVPRPASSEPLADNARLFEDCGLDSTSIIDLVLRVESEFGVSIQEEELDLDVLVDLSTVRAFIDRKRQESASQV